MADKEATVYVVDVGVSMAEKRLGGNESDLDWAMLYVWDRITSTIATGRKTAKVGVVGLRTDGTANALDNDESFHHISVLQNIDQILMRDLSKLRAKIKPSKTDDGDAISALVIAIQMISDHCKKLKYRRKIVLVTNGRGAMDDDGLEEIAKKITDDNMELVVLGVDFDDPEFGFKEEGKDPIKMGNEKLLRDLTDSVGGIFGTLAQAIAEMAAPRVKTVKPVRLFAGKLTLGDPESKEKMIEIDVERYPRTYVAKAPSASSFTLRPDVSNGTQASQASFFMPSGGASAGADDVARSVSNLVLVRNDRKYQVDDPSAPGGKRFVEREELAKGYEYGRTAVHLTESDENVTKLATHPGLQIVGFVPRQKYQRYFDMSVACVIIAGKVNNKASMALSSLIHALFELDSYAVARLVTKEDKPPLLVLLAPSIEDDYECLIDVQLPFAEDVRPYRFPPLDKILTVSGKVLTEHPNLPNKNLQAAMSDYVDRMDLSRFGKDDNGNPTEYMALADTYSPVLHRIDQAIRWRAVHPEEPVPPAPEILTKYSRPPEELQKQAQADLTKLIAAAAIEKVPPKPKGQKRKRETARPVSGLDVDALLGRERHASSTSSSASTPGSGSGTGTGIGTGTGATTTATTTATATISPDNAVPEFKQLLAMAADPTVMERAARQMGDAILALIRRGQINSPAAGTAAAEAGAGVGGSGGGGSGGGSGGSSSYGRVLEALRVMREEYVALEEPWHYNGFVRQLKAHLLAADGGGGGGSGSGSDDRRELWWQVRRARLGLITKRESDESDVTEDEGMQFLVASAR